MHFDKDEVVEGNKRTKIPICNSELCAVFLVASMEYKVQVSTEDLAYEITAKDEGSDKHEVFHISAAGLPYLFNCATFEGIGQYESMDRIDMLSVAYLSFCRENNLDEVSADENRLSLMDMLKEPGLAPERIESLGFMLAWISAYYDLWVELDSK